MIIQKIPNGLTVKELKKIVMGWSETDIYGDDCEVWVMTGETMSSKIREVCPLNKRELDGKVSADLLLDSKNFSI